MKNKDRTIYFKLFALLLFFVCLSSIISVVIKHYNIFQRSDGTLSEVSPVQTTSPVTNPSDWLTYTGYGLSFSYPSNWRIGAPNPQFINGNEINWSFDRAEDNNMTSTMSIILVKDYVPLPGVTDSRRSYFYESDTRTRREIVKEELFKNRRVLRYATNFSGAGQDSDTLVIEVPELSGILYVYFPDSFAHLTLMQAEEKYFLQFLQSLQINPSRSVWPETKPVLTNESAIETSKWKKYMDPYFSFMYPNTWQVTEKKDPDFANLTDIIITKSTSETINNNKIPQIIIGTPIVFSTAGTLCGNQTYGECLDMGQVQLKIKEKTYWGTIIDKNVRDMNSKRYEFFPSFYVFRLTPDRVPSQPSITAMFRNLQQGREIINILSTIEY